MGKYTRELIECPKCSKRNNFLVQVVQENKKYYYLTQCPNCKSYDEVKSLTPEAAQIYKASATGVSS